MRLMMTARSPKSLRHIAAALLMASLSAGCCNPCGVSCGGGACGGGTCGGGLCSRLCGGGHFGGCLCGGGFCSGIAGRERNMVPNVFPLGSVLRSHIHTEQTNAE